MLSATLARMIVESLEQLDYGVVVTDRHGKVTWVNAAFQRICGYELEELVGKKPGHVLQGPSTSLLTIARLHAAVSEGRPCMEEILNYHKDGHTYWVALHIAPIRGSSGEIELFIAFERDITLERATKGPPKWVTACSVCRKVSAGGAWLHLEHYVEYLAGVRFTHGFCPDCTEAICVK